MAPSMLVRIVPRRLRVIAKYWGLRLVLEPYRPLREKPCRLHSSRQSCNLPLASEWYEVTQPTDVTCCLCCERSYLMELNPETVTSDHTGKDRAEELAQHPR